jgi:hypothetical protein
MSMRWIGITLGTVFLVTVLAAAAWAGPPGRSGTTPNLYPDRLYDASRVLQQAAETPGVSLPRASGGKNAKVAMLYSLLLPGLGEQYLGHTGRAKGFFVAEGGIWTAFAIFRSQGAHRKDLYKEFAEVNAGVKQRNNDDYYRIVGNYLSSDGPFSANEFVRRQARALWPGVDEASRKAREQYLQENGYFGDNSWAWPDVETLIAYQRMRKSSLDAYHRADLTVGLLLANRLLSVLDVGLLAKRSGNDHAGLSWHIDAGPGGPGAQLTLARTF